MVRLVHRKRPEGAWKRKRNVRFEGEINKNLIWSGAGRHEIAQSVIRLIKGVNTASTATGLILIITAVSALGRCVHFMNH